MVASEDARYGGEFEEAATIEYEETGEELEAVV